MRAARPNAPPPPPRRPDHHPSRAVAKRGTPVVRVVNDGNAASAAAAAARAAGVFDEAAEEAPSEPEPIPTIDGIDQEQARAIREAVRARKQRTRLGDDLKPEA